MESGAWEKLRETLNTVGVAAALDSPAGVTLKGTPEKVEGSGVVSSPGGRVVEEEAPDLILLT